MTKVSKSKSKYQPTDAERLALSKQAQRQQEQPVAPRQKVVADYRGEWVELDHPDSAVGHLLLKEALGTADDDFCRGLLAQLYEFADLEDHPTGAESRINFLISTIKNGKPKDEQHAMLLALMTITFQAQMRIMKNSARINNDFLVIEKELRRKEYSQMINERNYSPIENLSRLVDSTERSFSRFARTYSMLLEASDRHRRSGEPSMTVQQVTVGSGGQAIVGNITHATPQTASRNPTTASRTLTHQPRSAMPTIGQSDRVAIPRRQRKKQ